MSSTMMSSTMMSSTMMSSKMMSSTMSSKMMSSKMSSSTENDYEVVIKMTVKFSGNITADEVKKQVEEIAEDYYKSVNGKISSATVSAVSDEFSVEIVVSGLIRPDADKATKDSKLFVQFFEDATKKVKGNVTVITIKIKGVVTPTNGPSPTTKTVTSACSRIQNTFGVLSALFFMNLL